MVLCAQSPCRVGVRVVVGVAWVLDGSSGGCGVKVWCVWPQLVVGVVVVLEVRGVVVGGGVWFVRVYGRMVVVVLWRVKVVVGWQLGGLPCMGMHGSWVCEGRSGVDRTCGRSRWLRQGRSAW